MAKLTIHVPDAMKADIEKWRGKLNFSQLFRDAFERAAQKAKRSSRRKRQIAPNLTRVKVKVEGTTPLLFDGRIGHIGFGGERPPRKTPSTKVVYRGTEKLSSFGQFTVTEFEVLE